MHWLDRLVGTLVAPRRSSLRFFHGGWGDPDRYAYFRDRVLLEPAQIDIDVRWDRTFSDRGGQVWDGQFVSGAENLPPGSQISHVRLLLPEGEWRRVCLLMAAWNDHGFDDRLPLARRLAQLGIAPIMFENPYFGRRRPVESDRHPVATVVDFATMALAAVSEGRALLNWLATTSLPGLTVGRPTVGVAGYSMGGNIAGAISALAPYPVATAAFAASHSPGPLISHGVLGLVIDWGALSGPDDPRSELVEFLSRLSLRNFAAPPHTAHAVLLAGRADGFIPIDAVIDFHRHWPGSVLRWTNEGHATLRFLRSPSLANATLEAFDRFEAAAATSGPAPLAEDRADEE